MTQTAHPDTVLIVDFGSQVTQLIARRVREAGVYCEIVPFQSAEEGFNRLKPKAVILSGSPASTVDIGSPRAPQLVFDSPCRCSASATASRPCACSSAARSKRPSPRIRPRLPRDPGGLRAFRRRLGQRLPPSGLDEPWRPRHGDARWLRGRRHLHERALCLHRRRGAENITPCSSIRKSCTRLMAPS